MNPNWNMFEAMESRYSGADGGQEDPIVAFRNFLTGLPPDELEIALAITRLAEGKESITMKEIEDKLGVPDSLKPAVRERVAPVLTQIRAYMLAMAQQQGQTGGGGGGGGGYTGGMDTIVSPAPPLGSGGGASGGAMPPSFQDVILPTAPLGGGIIPETGTFQTGVGRAVPHRNR